jgi:5-formyltetrahydrofolate cyclo-ligase
MQKAIQQAKHSLRVQVRADLARLTPEERAAASARACALLTTQEVWKRAQWVLFFAPLPTELDIWPLLQDALAAGKKVALPRFALGTNTYDPCQIIDLSLDLQPGQFGIREPSTHCLLVPPAHLDLILVPGVAFDSHGHRLGRGKGYYDQMLKGLKGTTCGVAFDQQVVGEIPVEAHDVRVDYVLTPTRWIKVKSEEREKVRGG